LDDDRNFVQSGALGGTPPALACDQVVAGECTGSGIAGRAGPHHERRDHAVRANRFGELGELRFVELTAGLFGARVELLDACEKVRTRLRLGLAHGRRRRGARQQRREATPEAALLRILGGHHAAG